MSEELMPFDLPKNNSSIIKVMGIGGGGSNAVNHMFIQGIKDVDFVICNTDSQALGNSPVPVKIQLGSSLTEGRGAGNRPDVGRQAAEENLDEIVDVLSSNTKMVFLTAGMGGGTGTGAAPVIAKAAKDLGILTVGIVTLPFQFEGQRRIKQAYEGIRELKNHVDSLLVINNEKLREIHGDLKVSGAFAKADDVLTVAAKGIAEIITVHGHLNVDFADVQTVMTNSGVALMGSASAKGEDRAIKAIEEALRSPLLNNNDIHGAKNILLNIISGNDEATMDEIGQINEYVQEAAGYHADLIWGNTSDEGLEDKISVTVIATGFETDIFPEMQDTKANKKQVHNLKDTSAPTKKRHKTADDLFFQEKDTSQDEENTQTTDTQSRHTPFDGKEIELEEDDPFAEMEQNSDEDLPLDENDIRERFKKLKTSRESISENNYSRANYTQNIEELEDIPAYKRKNVPLDIKKESTESNVSKYTLSDEDNGAFIRKNNTYLHDRVD